MASLDREGFPFYVAPDGSITMCGTGVDFDPTEFELVDLRMDISGKLTVCGGTRIEDVKRL